MAFTGEFTIAPASGFNVFTITDTSDYDDEGEETFLGRTIILTTTASTNLVPAGTETTYINFPYSGGNSITIDCMSRDYALNVQVDWESDAPQEGSIYEASLICGFGSYNNNNLYGVEKALTARPSVTQNKNYWLNVGKVQTEIYNSSQAIYYQQQISAQVAMNRAANILQNQLTNF